MPSSEQNRINNHPILQEKESIFVKITFDGKELLGKKLIDSVAMDIKAPLDMSETQSVSEHAQKPSVFDKLLKNDIVGGLDLGQYYPELKDCLLFCVTEVITKKNIDKLIEVLK